MNIIVTMTYTVELVHAYAGMYPLVSPVENVCAQVTIFSTCQYILPFRCIYNRPATSMACFILFISNVNNVKNLILRSTISSIKVYIMITFISVCSNENKIASPLKNLLVLLLYHTILN